MELIYHSEKLNMDYKIKHNSKKEKIIVFSDNVNYSENEMSKIKSCSLQGLKNIHNIKLIFEGIII